MGQGIGTTIPRIDEVRHAFAEVLPSATKFRRVGLISFDPGPYQQCNAHLDLKPMANAEDPIMRAVNASTPAGRTPLVSAVQQALTIAYLVEEPLTVHVCGPCGGILVVARVIWGFVGPGYARFSDFAYSPTEALA